MPLFLMSVKLAAYLACIGLTLKYSHRLSSRACKSIMSMDTSSACRAILSTLAAAIPFVCSTTATLVFAASSQANPLAILGLTWGSDSLALAWSGIVLGFACVMLMFSAGLLMGFIKVSRVNKTGSTRDQLAEFCSGSSDYLTGAVLEEIVIRGYTYYVLNELLGWSGAIVVSAVIFALAHLTRPNRIPFVFTINALCFGLLTGLCRYATGSLWLPIGLHLAWNVTAGPILGMPYSGAPYNKGLIRSDVSGPVWLMGGFYSPDAGMLGTCALLLAAVGLRLLAPMM